MSTKSRMSRQEWDAHWSATRRPLEDLEQHQEQLLAIIQEIRAADDLEPEDFNHIVRRHPFQGKRTFSKNQLVHAYRQLCNDGRLPFERDTLRKLQMKPVRTISGVAPVTVLTKPAPCPGRCIFCPEVEGQPKSYLPDEPGAARAATFDFDPHRQTAGRIATFEELGHSAEKVELLILGGSWSAYPADYQEWFIRRCLDAMNGREADSLAAAQRINETAPHRNVGLVIETRPDMITPGEIRRLRQLGVTKVQLGVQSLDDRILALNQRGHTVAVTRTAMRLLRSAGFKIAVHWMPNLYGATPESDRTDFARLWLDPALRPDELKIYPTALLEGTELFKLWQAGRYTPYTEPALVELVADCKMMVPPYCRINRVMRDIPAHNIVEGSTKSNLRQVVQRYLAQEGRRCGCIRCSEIRGRQVDRDGLRLDDLAYATDATKEHLLRFLTAGDRLAGFLRLSLPDHDREPVVAELRGHAVIREVHVYGPALAIRADSEGEAQHMGLGEQLIREALEIARAAGYGRLAVIAAIGTREYYRRHGFELGDLYMSRPTGRA
jgi:elongator complex protein 3